ncbi:MAG: hypothetical protein AAGC53_08150 [Actinomycetota bacterium]
MPYVLPTRSDFLSVARRERPLPTSGPSGREPEASLVDWYLSFGAEEAFREDGTPVRLP